jgi:Mg/Co/Ni transporter MgtE
MENVLITAMLVSTISTSAMAWDTEKRYTIVPDVARESICSNTDIAIGAAVGITAGIAAGVTGAAGVTLVGPGIAAGSKLGMTAALSQPFLSGTTIPMTAMSTAFLGPLAGMVGYYVSCVTRAVW